MDYEIRQLKFDDGDISLQKVVDLQNIVYAGKHTFKIEGFKHWYIDNPMGRVISFNAFYGDMLVAHYACVPYKMKICGRVAMGLFDMATVTHPEHRGKGLFKRLAQITYDYAREHGYEFVLGVANANSFPGYMKYFPFTNIGQLEVRMGLGQHIEQAGDKAYSVYWDAETFAWRSRCCKANYSMCGSQLLGRYNSYVHTYMGVYPQTLMKEAGMEDKQWGWRPKLYVGLGASFKSIYLKVPKFIKRSPFNLIFLDLTQGTLPIVSRDNIFFQLFDFDVA